MAREEPSQPTDTETDSGRFPWARTVARDGRYLLTRPFRLDRRGWAKAAAVGTATLSLYALREEIREAAQEHRTEGRDRFVKGARSMGKAGVAPILALSALGASLATRNPRERETALLLLESAGYSALVAGIGQLVLATDRPRDGDRIRLFRGGGHGVSMDAALASSIVEPLRRQYLTARPGEGPGRKAAKTTGAVLLYAGAALTAYQRVNADAHWAPDAFLGAMTGLFVGGMLCDAHGKGAHGRIEASAAPLPGRGASFLVRVRMGSGLDR